MAFQIRPFWIQISIFWLCAWIKSLTFNFFVKFGIIKTYLTGYYWWFFVFVSVLLSFSILCCTLESTGELFENTWALILRGSDLVYPKWELLCMCALQVAQMTLKSSPGSGLIPQWSICLFPTLVLGVPVRGTKHICALILGLCLLATHCPSLFLPLSLAGIGSPGSVSV